MPDANPVGPAIMKPVGLVKGVPSEFMKKRNRLFAALEKATVPSAACGFPAKGLKAPSLSEKVDAKRAALAGVPRYWSGVNGEPLLSSIIPLAFHPPSNLPLIPDCPRRSGKSQTKWPTKRWVRSRLDRARSARMPSNGFCAND
jgi:hypothetical protein